MNAEQLSLFSITDTQEEYRKVRLKTHEARLVPCESCECRQEAAPLYGRGALFPTVAFVTEAPSRADEGARRILSGDAERVVTRMLGFLEIPEEKAYLCSAMCCRPPRSRPPTPEELLTCRENVLEQLVIVQPTVIVALGLNASRALFNTSQPMEALRGEWLKSKGIPVRVTHHPFVVLKHRIRADECKEDLQAVRRRLRNIREAEK